MKNKKMNYLCLNWLKNQKYLVKESTYSCYSRIVYNHIIPYFNNILLKKIDKNLLTEFNHHLLTNGNKKNNNGLSNKMVKDINIVLKQILNFYNKNIDIKTPKVNRKEVTILSDDDYNKLKDYCLNNLDSYTLGIIICLYTGLRIGEICALKWEDIILDKGIINIKHTIQRIKDYDSSKSKIIIESAKTDFSIRQIPINKVLLDLLKSNKTNNNFHVLTNSYKYIEPRTYYKRYKTILRKLDLPNYTFHALRHTFATKCTEIGVDAKSLSEILGHSNIRTTLSLYVHPSIEIKKAYMDKLCEL